MVYPVAENEKIKEEMETFADTELEQEETAEAEKEEAAEEEDTEEVSEKDEKTKEGKNFFKKDKKNKKDSKDQKIEELNERLIRNMAEFDNFRKRSEKEKAQMFEVGAKDIIEKILPVLDNFERGLDAITEEEKGSAFAQGIEQIYKQFITVLEEAGVKPIEAVGKEFDPNLHNAVMHGEDENFGENTISDEFQKGYTYRDTVVRHSMVKVVN